MSIWNREPESTDSPALTPPTRPTDRPATAGSSAAVIGSSIAIRGELAGEQDLLIEGHFEGQINIPGHKVTIGRSGRVQAEIHSKVVVVEGELNGNTTADQQAIVRASGRVHGDIKAPQVALEEGCHFKGAIDMEPKQEPSKEAPSTPDAAPSEPAEAKADAEAATDSDAPTDEASDSAETSDTGDEAESKDDGQMKIEPGRQGRQGRHGRRR